jgi:23S rRNA (guanosine2251-2'-O)-methyltransferase
LHEMENFPFLKKRFISLPEARRHKWVTVWLRDNYLALQEKRFSEKSLENFFQRYGAVLSWLGEPEASLRRPASYGKWLEFVSERFHHHQRKSGKGLSEAGFLPRVARGDREHTGKRVPRIPYRVALDNIRSAFNVGSILRVMDAVGFESALISGNTPGKENGRVRKTAMGCAEWIPVRKYKGMHEALKRARKNGFTIVGVETIPDSCIYSAYPWPRKGIVVLGNEEYGISEDVLKVCDDFVHLPMSGIKNSINVANAFAVIAFHISGHWILTTGY